MDSSPDITLPQDIVGHCLVFGHRVVDNYANGRSNASLAVSSHNAQSNPVLQANAKGAECAFCYWAGIDPLLELDWFAHIDHGFDVLWKGRRIDVKGTNGGQYLIWPMRKTSFLADKPIDVFVLVRGFLRFPDPSRFTVVRWIDKETFLREHETAGEGHKLAPGTWFMHWSAMRAMSELDYDARADTEAYFSESYRAIRERKAAGGKGWEPKERVE